MVDRDPRIALSASLLWSQRHNPPWLEVPTVVAAFRRSSLDASSWKSPDGHWAAELRRAARGEHVSLAIWRDGTLLGTSDGRHGWRATGRNRAPRRRPPVAVQLALAS